MSMMSIKNVIVLVTALFVFACTVAAQENTQAPPAKVIQHVPVKSVSPASGKDMYMSYCAVCHGTDGQGGGPAASALKVPPTDLTLLSKTNGGKYPALSSGHQSEVQQRVVNLTRYIETMQAK